MKQFNLEKALAGEPVITRDGTIVKEIKLFNTISTLKYPLCANVGGQIISYTISGRYALNESDRDLFMQSTENILYTNVYLTKNGEYNIGYSYNSFNEAIANNQEFVNGEYIDTVEINFKH